MNDLELASRQRAEARVGQVLRGKWQLDRLIGVGGMASVYAATHRNGKRGAVKLLHPELAGSEFARSRFLREGYVANTVAHPGAVSVLDDDATDEGAVFLVMELLEGQTIDEKAQAREGQRLEVSEVLELTDKLLDVLAAAHDKGIVHRDLKPENLFATSDGGVRVLDFGIARLRQGGASAASTRTGDAMGTPAFMPPEQALGDWDSVDGRTDLWAVGATMFTLLTNRFVHEADNVQKTMLAAMTKPAPSLALVDPSIPASVIRVVDRALSSKQEDRWSDARAMQAAVREAVRDLGGPVDRARAEVAVTLPSHRAGAGGIGPGPEVTRPPHRASGIQATTAPVSGDARPDTSARRRGIYASVAVIAVALVGLGVWAVALRGGAPGSVANTSTARSESTHGTQQSSGLVPLLPSADAPVPSISVAEEPPRSDSVSASSTPSALPSVNAPVAPSGRPSQERLPAPPKPSSNGTPLPAASNTAQPVPTTFHGRF